MASTFNNSEALTGTANMNSLEHQEEIPEIFIRPATPQDQQSANSTIEVSENGEAQLDQIIAPNPEKNEVLVPRKQPNEQVEIDDTKQSENDESEDEDEDARNQLHQTTVLVLEEANGKVNQHNECDEAEDNEEKKNDEGKEAESVGEIKVPVTWMEQKNEKHQEFKSKKIDPEQEPHKEAAQPLTTTREFNKGIDVQPVATTKELDDKQEKTERKQESVNKEFDNAELDVITSSTITTSGEDDLRIHNSLLWATAKSSKIQKGINDWPTSAVIVKLRCPCKKGKTGDKIEQEAWRCFKCLQFLVFDRTQYFHCSCGKGHITDYAFGCLDTNHGPEFLKSTMNAMQSQLKHLQDAEETNILLIGESGAGKSTWINAFLNYCTFRNIDEAINQKNLLYRIPVHFTVYKLTDGENCEYEQVVVSHGSDENEKYAPGQSVTQSSQSYRFPHGNRIVHIIDTPGMGDTRGSEVDDKNFQNIMEKLFNLPSLHGICVLLNPNSARLTLTLRRCIADVFQHINDTSAKNLVFCFTHTRSTFYKPGDTYTSLKALIKEMGLSEKVKLDSETMYCVDNEALRYLSLVKSNIPCTASDKHNVTQSWDKSVSELERMVNRFTESQPHPIPKKKKQVVSKKDLEITVMTACKDITKTSESKSEKPDATEVNASNIVRVTEKKKISDDEDDSDQDETYEDAVDNFSPGVDVAKNCTSSAIDGQGNVEVEKATSTNQKDPIISDDEKVMNQLLHMNIFLCQQIFRVQKGKQDKDAKKYIVNRYLDDLRYLMLICAKISLLIEVNGILQCNYELALLDKADNQIKLDPTLKDYIDESREMYRKQYTFLKQNSLKDLKQSHSVKVLIEDAYKISSLKDKYSSKNLDDSRKVNRTSDVASPSPDQRLAKPVQVIKNYLNRKREAL